MGTSTAYILLRDWGYKYTFDGVISISHSLTLKVEKDSDAALGSEYINNARNEPDIVTLSVVASDVNSKLEDWSGQVLRSLADIKEKRILCQVVTSLRSYENMLLTELSVLQDETCPYGWMGTLTFTKAEAAGAPAEKTDDNASTPSNTGITRENAAAEKGSTFQTILREAGI